LEAVIVKWQKGNAAILPHLGQQLLHELLGARDEQDAAQLVEQHDLRGPTGEREDVLAHVVKDDEAGLYV
jgi:hypothetical protein